MSSSSLTWPTLAELKRDRASFAELLTEEELEELHVSAEIDEGLLEALDEEGKRVYLTGNPGDGKTHVIQKYRSDLESIGALVETDASAVDESELAREIGRCISEGRPALIAVNEGPLRQLLPKLPDSEKEQIAEQLNRPFIYGEEEEKDFDALLLNLGVRQVLSPGIIEGVLDVALSRTNYDGAPEAVQRNREALRRAGVQERLRRLLRLVARSGRHVTMHELLGFVAHLVTGGRRAAEAAQGLPPYYALAFSEGSPFAEVLGALDPAGLAHPLIDMYLWDGQPPGAVEWTDRPPAEDAPALAPDAEAASRMFDQRKRRFFFEAAGGEALLDLLPSDRADFYDLLDKSAGRRRDTANVRVLEALAAFFGGSGTDDIDLPVWTGLRYDADGPPEAFVANQYLEREDTELLVPRLRSGAARFIEYEPDHLLLRLRSSEQNGSRRDAPQPSLRIDLSLWLELARLRRGLPARYRDAATERKLFRFLSQVAASTRRTAGYARLSVRDAETGDTYQTEVSLDEGVYRL